MQRDLWPGGKPQAKPACSALLLPPAQTGKREGEGHKERMGNLEDLKSDSHIPMELLFFLSVDV